MGLLALGGADLIWLNGWLAPAILADKVDETNSHQYAIGDSHQSKATPGSIAINEAPPKKENTLNDSNMPNSDKVEHRSLKDDSSLPLPSEELAHKTVEVNNPVNSAETVAVIDPVNSVETAEVIDPVNSAETADKRVETAEVIDPVNSVETADKQVEAAEVIADHTDPKVPEQTATASSFTVLFQTDSYTLSKFNLKRIRMISRVIKDTESRVQLTGHADKRGLAPYNEVLATNRADSVVRELQRLGVKAEEIDSKTMGERAPLANASLSKQRRVEIHLLKRE